MVDINVFGGMLAKVYGMYELDECELMDVLHETKSALQNESSLLEMAPPVVVCGDIHGQFYDVVRIFASCGWPPERCYLFLGDYVDRGTKGMEVISLLFLLKCLFPNQLYLLRGNHENHNINVHYGFHMECCVRYSETVYNLVQETFSNLPVACLVSDRIFCVHGGLSPKLYSFNQIRSIEKPMKSHENQLVNDMLWSDPESCTKGWLKSRRGAGYMFGPDVVDEFCNRLDIDLVVRAHQVVDNGYAFFANRKCLTIFSAPNYCGVFSNSAGMLLIDCDMACHIVQMQPKTNDDEFK